MANLVEPQPQSLNRVLPYAPIPAEIPPVHSPTRTREFLSERQGCPIGCKESGDHERVRAMHGPDRAARSEAFGKSCDVPPELYEAERAAWWRIIALPMMLDLSGQRNSLPMTSCNALGSFTRPSAV